MVDGRDRSSGEGGKPHGIKNPGMFFPNTFLNMESKLKNLYFFGNAHLFCCHMKI